MSLQFIPLKSWVIEIRIFLHNFLRFSADGFVPIEFVSKIKRHPCEAKKNWHLNEGSNGGC